MPFHCASKTASTCSPAAIFMLKRFLYSPTGVNENSSLNPSVSLVCSANSSRTSCMSVGTSPQNMNFRVFSSFCSPPHPERAPAPSAKADSIAIAFFILIIFLPFPFRAARHKSDYSNQFPISRKIVIWDRAYPLTAPTTTPLTKYFCKNG